MVEALIDPLCPFKSKFVSFSPCLRIFFEQQVEEFLRYDLAAIPIMADAIREKLLVKHFAIPTPMESSPLMVVEMQQEPKLKGLV